MTPAVRNLVMLLLISLLAACNLPRGAALTSQVLKEQDKENPSFQVVQVTRAALANLVSWPETRSTGGIGWIKTSRGPESQVIRSGDRVSIMVWDSQENSLLMAPGAKTANMPELPVGSDGSIFMPYVGNIRVSGQTAAQARATVQKALVDIAPQSQVQLTMQSGQGNAVDVVAGVPRPGVYPLPDRNSSILTVLSLAGGITPTMRNPLVRLIRDGKTYEVPAERLFSEPGLNTLLRGQDKIFVEEDKRYFTALGASGSERLINFDRDRISALEAMSIMGGLLDGRANPKGVLILREYPASALRKDGKGPEMRQVVFTLDLTSADGLFAARNFSIQPKDTILVTESPVVAAATIIGLLNATLSSANTVDVIATRN